MKMFIKGLMSGMIICTCASAVYAADPSLLKIYTVPENPKVGEAISVFVQPKSMIPKEEYVFELFFNTTKITMTKTATDTWVGYLRPLHEVRTHQLRFDAYIQNEKEAIRIRSARSVLLKEISDINTVLQSETNPTKIQNLTDEKTQKQLIADQLLEDLTNLKNLLKTETTELKINPDPNNTNYPLITAVSRAVVPVGKRIKTMITGQNFNGTPQVRIGGLGATILSSTPTSIEVLAPNFTTAGAKDSEVILPAVTTPTPIPRKNALLANSFFVSNEAILKNIKPVVVTTGYVTVTQTTFAPITLSAAGSYDENLDLFDYEWSITKVPVGSALTLGTTLANSVSPQFTPDQKGIYTFKVRVKENNTTELYASSYSTVTIEVK